MKKAIRGLVTTIIQPVKDIIFDNIYMKNRIETPLKLDSITFIPNTTIQYDFISREFRPNLMEAKAGEIDKHYFKISKSYDDVFFGLDKENEVLRKNGERENIQVGSLREKQLQMVTGENNIISLSSENVNLMNTENFHLSIEISPRNICYVFLNTENLEFIFFKSVSVSNISELINHISSEDKLKLNYSSCSVSYKNFPSTLIPNKLFNSDKKNKYIDFVLEEVESIKIDNLHHINKFSFIL